MKISVGFSCPKKFKIGAALIIWWAGKPYSHVYFKYTDAQGRNLIFHAAHGTVHQILVPNFEETNRVILEIPLIFSEKQYQELRDIFYEKCGKLYSTKQIMLMPVHDLLAKIGIRLKTSDDSGYICSELVGYTLSKIKGIKFDKPFNYLRPDDIEKALTKK